MNECIKYGFRGAIGAMMTLFMIFLAIGIYVTGRSTIVHLYETCPITLFILAIPVIGFLTGVLYWLSK